MRILSVFLVLLIVLQSLLPCGDIEVQVRSSNSNTIQKHDQTAKDAPDECSPFCSCACCTSPSVIKQTTLKLQPLVFLRNAKNIIADGGKYIDISLPVWQPPQIA